VSWHSRAQGEGQAEQWHEAGGGQNKGIGIARARGIEF
jgi:hypothetical protein